MAVGKRLPLSRRSFLCRGAAMAAPALVGGCSAVPGLLSRESGPAAEDPALEPFGLDREAIDQAMKALTGEGAQAADIYLQRGSRRALRLDHGEAEALTTERFRGAGLRVLGSDGAGFAAVDEPTPESLAATAGRVANGSAEANWQPPDAWSLREPGALYPVDAGWGAVGRARLVRLLEGIDARCRAADPAVRNVTVNWSGSDEEILIATEAGRLAADRRPMTRLSVEVSATRGDITHSGFASIAARAGLEWYTEERLDALADRAVDRTLILFDARLAPSGDMPVILAAGTGGVLLHEAIGHAFEADFVNAGTSPYRGRVGEAVAGDFLTLVDDARLARRRGALDIDDEGEDGRRNVLVENGRLAGFLYDRVTARASGVAPTGSARRESFRHAPLPRMTCTYIDNGTHAREELIAAVDRGVIAEVITGGSVTPGSGEFAFTVRHGWLVADGRVAMPLRDFEVSGNGPQALADITMLADDLAFDEGGWTCSKRGQRVPVSQGMPSALVSRLAVRSLA